MRSILADQARSEIAGDERLERWAAYAPLVIIFYFALQLAVRFWLSPNLEVDDAEMLGHIHWAWGYANSHPPLFHWLVRLSHDLFGNWVAATSVPKYALLAAGYLLIYDAGRRATDQRLTGALAAASLLFIPVIAWKTQGKLTHSILGFTATAATMHATVLILTRRHWWTFAWLGFAAAVGVLAKYNYLFVLLALIIAVAAVRDARRAFSRPPVLLAIVVVLALITPHLIWVRANAGLAVERVNMLQTGGGPLGLNLRADSVSDGLVSLFLVVLVSVLPVAAVWAVASAIAPRPVDELPARNGSAETIARLVSWLVVAELLLFAAAVVIGGFSQVHERYLVVLLPPIGLWFALKMRRRSAAVVLSSTIALALFITVARPLSVLRGTGRLMFPYGEMARDIGGSAPLPFAVLADRPENAANIVIRLPAAHVFDARMPAERVVVTADIPARASAIAQRLAHAYVPEAEVRTIVAPFRSNPGRQAELAVQTWRRAGANPPP